MIVVNIEEMKQDVELWNKQQYEACRRRVSDKEIRMKDKRINQEGQKCI